MQSLRFLIVPPGGGNAGSRAGKGPASIGGGIGRPVNLRSDFGGGIAGVIGGAAGGSKFGIGSHRHRLWLGGHSNAPQAVLPVPIKGLENIEPRC